MNQWDFGEGHGGKPGRAATVFVIAVEIVQNIEALRQVWEANTTLAVGAVVKFESRESTFSLPLMSIWYPTKMYFAKLKKTYFVSPSQSKNIHDSYTEKSGDTKVNLKISIFGCSRIFNLFQSFNDWSKFHQ